MKKLLALLCALPVLAWAQSAPNWPAGYQPTAEEWNAEWASKQDYAGPRTPERVNVRDWGAVCDNVTDDRDAFASAIGQVNTLEQLGIRTILYVPPGMCRIFGTNGALPMFAQSTQGGVIGAGVQQSWVIMDASYTGDLFSWDSSWMSTTFPFNGNTVLSTSIKVGPTARDITVVGNRSAAANQYAFHLYNRNDMVSFSNVDIFYVKGGCISVGDVRGGSADAGIRESNFSHIRCYNSGNTNVPAIDFNQAGVGGGTPVALTDINIYAPYWTGLAIRAMASGGSVRNYLLNSIRIEGLESNPTSIQADLFSVGDIAAAGITQGIVVNGLQLISPYTGFCGLRVTAPTAPLRPFNIDMRQINVSRGGGTGKGVCLDALRDSEFQFVDISTTDTNITIGPLSVNLTITGGTDQSAWTWGADPAVKQIGVVNGIFPLRGLTTGFGKVGASVLIGTTTDTTDTRLTTDGTAANTGNCFNLSLTSMYSMSVLLTARNATDTNSWYSWALPQGVLAGPTPLWSAGTPAVLVHGTTAGAAVTASADTTNKCLNLSFTPPTGNAGTWNVSALLTYSLAP